MSFKILAINPGSTSTKIAVYQDENPIFLKVIDHPIEQITQFDSIQEQLYMRKSEVLKALRENNIELESLSAIVGRGGILPPVKSGAYLVNEEMIDMLRFNPIIEHASNLGGIISYEIAKPLGIDSFIYDSVSVDEMIDVARPSGHVKMDRTCLSHALNSRAMAIRYSKNNKINYHELNLIVAHLGGGISLSLHEKGCMIDVVSDDEGPFSPERSGRVPCKKLIDLCFSGKYTHNEILKMIRGKGGIISYLGTLDVRNVEKMIDEGNEYAKLIYDSMIYQISKGIGELSTVVDGNIDAIIITGGIAFSKNITSGIRKKVEFIAPVEVLPGENELESLAFGILRVLRKEENYKEFYCNKK